MSSTVTTSEPGRLEALYDYQILDTPAEEVFDTFTRLASQLCAAPVSLLNLIDEDRVWIKSAVGLAGVGEAPRTGSFCEAAIHARDLIEINDTLADPRWTENPLVKGEWGVRFYAGVPLITRSGYAIGTLCVMDVKPRKLSAGQRDSLRTIAAAVLDQLDARRTLMRLVDASRSELYHFDLAQQRIVFASEGALRNLGYTAKEIRALPIGALLPKLREPFSPQRLTASIARRDGEPLILDTVAKRKDGSTYPVELRVELVHAQSRLMVYVFGIDLTERRKTEERLRLLSTAVDNASDAVTIYQPPDPPDPAVPGTVVYANDAFLQATGYTREDVVGQSSALFSARGPDKPMIEAARARALRGESVRLRARTYRKDGSEFWTDQTVRPLLDHSGKVTHVVTIRRDVTAEVLHETALATQNDILTALTTVARELFAALEPRTFVDRLRVGASAITGADITFWAALPGGGLVPSDDLSFPEGAKDRSDAFLRDALGSEVVRVDGPSRRAAARIPRPGGGGWLLEAKAPDAEPLATSSIFALGLVAHYAAVAVRNVELYTELDARRGVVVELNQVKADLIAMLAHDFNGPLTSIVGFAQILAEDPKLDAQSRHWLDTITQNAMRLSSLASDTLAISRLENADFSLVRQPVDLAELVRDVVATFAQRRKIHVRVQDPSPVTHGDGQRLRQVVENLVGNAIKYSPSGEDVNVTIKRAGDMIELQVKDRGIGVPPAELANLFSRFARGSNARRLGITGTGFGLYLAKLIVEKHGGTIGVTSVEDEGSTFTVRLPPASGDGAEDRPHRVLLIDPEGEARSFTAHELRVAHYRIRVATTMLEALAILADERFDAALVDGASDALNIASKVSRRVRREVAFLRVGRGATEGTDWDGVIAKPFLSKDLASTIDHAVKARATT